MMHNKSAKMGIKLLTVATVPPRLVKTSAVHLLRKNWSMVSVQYAKKRLFPCWRCHSCR